MKLSILDLIPVFSDSNTAAALQASRSFAKTADEIGFTRFWVAEHHNAAAVASTVPGVLIPYLAAGTSQIRFGSGGVMLPNHTAYAIAEQFSLLEAMYPNRIDLGIGRAPGTDALSSAVLRNGAPAEAVSRFPQEIALIRELLGRGATSLSDTVAVQIGEHNLNLRATPKATTAPDLWLLGSSMYSAQLAAAEGLPYIFAHHFGMPGLEQAINYYRNNYQASESYPEPRTLIPVTVAVAETKAIAQERSLSQRIQSAHLRTGKELTPGLTLEQALAYDWDARERIAAEQASTNWFVGDYQQVSEELRDFAKHYQVDELMLNLAISRSEAEDPAGASIKNDAIRMLSEQLLD